MKLAQALARALRALYLARRASPSKVKQKRRELFSSRLRVSPALQVAKLKKE
jgi:hypothetical protein